MVATAEVVMAAAAMAAEARVAAMAAVATEVAARAAVKAGAVKVVARAVVARAAAVKVVARRKFPHWISSIGCPQGGTCGRHMGAQFDSQPLQLALRTIA